MASSDRLKRGAVLGLVGVLIAGILIIELLVRAHQQGSVSGLPYVRTLDGSTETIEVVLSWGDGQGFDAVAKDPLLREPGVFRGGAPELAYRAQRPLLAYLAYAGALGRPGWTGWALVVLVTLSAGAAAWAAGALIGLETGKRWLALGVVLLPGGLAAVTGLTADLLALALFIAALLVLRDARERPVLFYGLVAASALARETMLIGLAAVAVGPGVPRHVRRRAVTGVLAGGAVAAAWMGVVRLAVGLWPFEAGQGRLGRPLRGILLGMDAWGGDQVVVAAIGAVLIGAAIARRPRRLMTWIAAAYLVFGLFLGPQVYQEWENFSRVLLPAYVFALFALVLRAEGARGLGDPAFSARHAG